MNDNKNIKKPLYFSFFRGIVTALSALVLKSTVSFAILLTYAANTLVEDMPNYLMYIVVFISSILVYNSVFSLFLTFDKTACQSFFDTAEGNTDFISALKSKSFLIQITTVSLLMAVISALGAAPEIAGMFYFESGKSPYSTGIIPLSATLILVPIIFIFQKYEAARYWKILKKEGNLQEIENKKKIVFRAAVICIAYPLVLPYLPTVAYFLISLFRIAITLFSAPAVIIFIVVVILSLFFIKILISLNKRRLLLKRLRTLSKELSIELSDIKNPYRSLLNYRKSCSFTMKTMDDLFHCTLLGTTRRGVPVCFTSENTGYYRYRIGTKKHNITLEKQFEYGKETKGKKIVVICPTPKEVLLCDQNKEKRLFNAEKMWDSIVYEADAFLAAIDRECLGRHSTVAYQDDVKIPKNPYIN